MRADLALNSAIAEKSATWAALGAAGTAMWTAGYTGENVDQAAAGYESAKARAAAAVIAGADARANAMGIADDSPEWAQYMRSAITDFIPGRQEAAAELQAYLATLPAFALGGYVPASVGGTVVRVAEAGDGEHIIGNRPPRNMFDAQLHALSGHLVSAATAMGGSTTIINEGHKIEINGTVIVRPGVARDPRDPRRGRPSQRTLGTDRLMVSVPDIQVTAWWTLTGPNQDLWTVEDPVRGALDDYGIAGDLETEITSYVRPGITISRGRSRATDEIATGTAQVTLNNQSRIFDPFNASSPLAGNIRPGKKFSIRVGGVTRFTGTSRDFDYLHRRNEVNAAVVSLEDSLGALARAELDAYTTTPGTAADLINEALDRPEVNFGANRNIAGGVSTLGAIPVDQGTKVLPFVQRAARSDLGRVFADPDDIVSFRDRLTVIPDGTAPVAYFADDGTGLRYKDRGISYGSDLLFTRTVVSRIGGSTEIADDIDAAAEFGQLSTGDTYTDLFLDSDDQSSQMAEFLLYTGADPELRVSAITVRLMSCRDELEQAQVLSLDIGSLIHVTFTPGRTGAPIKRYAVVEGIRERIQRRREHDITFLLGDVLQFGVWTVEDPVLGALDGAGIAF